MLAHPAGGRDQKPEGGYRGDPGCRDNHTGLRFCERPLTVRHIMDAFEATDTQPAAPPATPEPPGSLARARARVGRPFARRPWTFEVAIFALALVVYQVSRALVIGDTATAFNNAWDVVHWEKKSGLFVETHIQEWVLNHLDLTQFLNWFYMYGHWTITPVFFVWLYRRRRSVYPYVRNAFLAANAIALMVFVAFPVAPPRLLSSAGLVDTLKQVSDIDLHGGVLSGWFNPYAAVPSMHFGYAFMIGVVGFALLSRWPLRILALCYPAVVFLTITATANHYVIDSVAGGVVIAMGFAAVAAWIIVRARLGSQAFPR